MTILVTGSSGFIGFHVCRELLKRGKSVIGLDAMNDYYDVSLKEKRLALLKNYPSFHFVKLDLSHAGDVQDFFRNNQSITQVVHLAAQAGVRYSLTHPFVYAESNFIGHLAVLEGCRILPDLKHVVYASSSSVYGANTRLPFAAEDRTDHPISVYAVTKKSCELMSECYSHLYRMPVTGLRFFTVYGPWGRPDMSPFIFTKAILEEREFPVYNHGNIRRNFTCIDDIVSGTLACLDKSPINEIPEGQSLHRIYNLGNDRSESVLDFIGILERLLGKKARIRLEEMQPGDVPETIADISPAFRDFGFRPQVNIEKGMEIFVSWYREYYGI